MSEQRSEKKCRVCESIKSVDEFYLRKETGKNRKTCKVCCKIQSDATKKAHPERYAEYRKKWSENNPEKVKQSRNKYRENHPDRDKESQNRYKANNRPKILAKKKEHYKNNKIKHSASRHMNYLIKKGQLVRGGTCQECGTDKYIEGHHYSYRKEDWDKVVWLCSSCHRKEHLILQKDGIVL